MKKLSAVVGITMLVVAGVIFYQVNGLSNVKGDLFQGVVGCGSTFPQCYGWCPEGEICGINGTSCSCSPDPLADVLPDPNVMPVPDPNLELDNPLPPTPTVDPPVVTITPPTTNTYTPPASENSSSGIMQSSQSSMICADKGQILIERSPEYVNYNQWSSYKLILEASAKAQLEGKCASNTHIKTQKCNIGCSTASVSNTELALPVTYGKGTDFKNGVQIIWATASAKCYIKNSCNCPTNNSQCTKM